MNSTKCQHWDARRQLRCRKALLICLMSFSDESQDELCVYVTAYKTKTVYITKWLEVNKHCEDSSCFKNITVSSNMNQPQHFSFLAVQAYILISRRTGRVTIFFVHLFFFSDKGLDFRIKHFSNTLKSYEQVS